MSFAGFLNILRGSSYSRKVISVLNFNNAYAGTINDVRMALGKPRIALSPTGSKKRLYVLDFKGDVMATQADALTHEVSAVLHNIDYKKDEVLIRLESPGGAAHAYGYAASQIDRLVKMDIRVTVAVDRVAASGGYMMACVANKVIAAPFSIIGSVGVVSEFPNVFNALQKMGVDYKQYTAGKYKRTISQMGEITEEGELKFKEDLEEMHTLFKNHIVKHRPMLKESIEDIATGEHWFGEAALERGLVDEILTSEEYIVRHIIAGVDVLGITFVGNKKTLAEKLSSKLAASFADSLLNALYRVFMKMTIEARLYGKNIS